MVAEILGQAAPLGGYIAIWKVIIFILLFGLWAWVGQWLDNDAVAVRTKRLFWNYIYMGTGVFAFLMWFLLPAPFVVVFPLFLVVWITASITYVIHRNARVPRDKKILTREHIRFVLSREGKKEIEARLRLLITGFSRSTTMLGSGSKTVTFFRLVIVLYDLAKGRALQELR